MKVLSLFDGIGGARQALKELGVECEYYASEIDKYAIQIAKANHPDIIQLGDVNKIKVYYEDRERENFLGFNDLNRLSNMSATRLNIDLLIGGFPCQSFSIAGNRKGFEDERGNLFFELLRILKEVKPRYFLFENVASMGKENQAFISEKLGVDPIMINSALLTAQNRKRLYWTNIPNVKQPHDKGVQLKDIIEEGVVDRDKSYCIDANYHKGGNLKSYFEKGRRQLVFKAPNNKLLELPSDNILCTFKEVRTEQGKKKRAEYRKLTGLDSTKRGPEDKKYIPQTNNKANCLMTSLGIEGSIAVKDQIRKLTVNECCRLQGFPDDYCSMVSPTQAYKALGNSFTVPVIKHILSKIIPKQHAPK